MRLGFITIHCRVNILFHTLQYSYIPEFKHLILFKYMYLTTLSTYFKMQCIKFVNPPVFVFVRRQIYLLREGFKKKVMFIQVGDVTESEFYWTKILKSKVCCPLNFFSKNENIGCY